MTLIYRGAMIEVIDCGFPLVKMPRKLVRHYGLPRLACGMNVHECARHLGMTLRGVLNLQRTGKLAKRVAEQIPPQGD